jgi:uncharacterized membrane protein YeaQ/YmgE (transglycosylase-associated protein family)
VNGDKLTEPEKFKLRNLLWGFIVPVIVGLVIILFATVLRSALLSAFPVETGSPIPHILTFGFAQMILFGIPMLLGLLWNKWAGGAAGFLTGTVYYLSMAGYSSFTYLSYGQTWNFFADASLLTYIVVGILIGYIAGALSNKSYKFKRMLGAGLTAAITTGLLQFLVNYEWALEPNRAMTLGDPGYAFFLVMLPQVILGILVPIVARISVGSELWHP